MAILLTPRCSHYLTEPTTAPVAVSFPRSLDRYGPGLTAYHEHVKDQSVQPLGGQALPAPPSCTLSPELSLGLASGCCVWTRRVGRATSSSLSAIGAGASTRGEMRLLTASSSSVRRAGATRRTG